MSLTPGSRLGPYQIVATLGAGGMGQVFRARDPRLGRDVAIKALPEDLARDPERVARFEREARLLASLNHPNIAGIYGLEEVEGHRYLVLELVEGDTLAARLSLGALPLDDAFAVCRQIAAAVEVAHEAGVVHRDLKPGNVMLRPDGTVKVLDFGLAKLDGRESAGSNADLPNSPTMSAATSAGMILGTAAYMSPEQARGRAVDKRTDIWSFGCVLYQCLTAKQAFAGETVSDTIAAILRSEPDWRALPSATPARIRELLTRCLCKDPRDRLRDIGEARVLLTSVVSGESSAVGASAGAVPTTRGRTAPLWLAAAAVGIAVVSVAALLARRPSAHEPLRRLDLVANGIEMDWFFAPAISPDGSRIAYISKDRVWVRDLEQLEPRPVADADGVGPLAWSPDSRAILFDDRKRVWKVAVTGGTPIALCAIPGTGSLAGLSVSRAGNVAFSVWRGGVYQVSADGGAPTLLFDVDPAEMVDFHAISWLPNGDLFHLVHWRSAEDSSGKRKPEAFVFAGGKRIPVQGAFGGPNGCPVLASTGKMLYLRRDVGTGIWAVPYDMNRRRVTGEARLVAADAASISVSEMGTLLYMEGNAREGPNELVWVDRSGKVIGTVGAPRPGLTNAVLSPDARRIAFTATQANNEDVWVRDLDRGTDTRITFSEASELRPQWFGPSRLAYLEEGLMKSSILAVNADGSGDRTVMAPPVGIGYQVAYFAPDRKSAARIIDDGGHGRLRISPVLGTDSLGAPERLLRLGQDPDVEDARISGDGKLIAYGTNDSGSPEVFLTRFPSGEGQWQVSNEGGRRPRWARLSGELFYIGGGGPSRRSMYAVPIDPSRNPPMGTPVRLFEIDPRWLRQGEMPYDITPDGQRLLMAREATGADSRPSRMILMQNWESVLAKQAQAGTR